ncbi:MAG: glycoside-pentoside-hexuronide (GPH):cation symporter [Firmicutes bacterium]|nr:glycoside-pentoside-hexuronide (GPH):cation symporter [Bacillota bacterium]
MTPVTTPKRNRWTFGLGTIGRDMVYSMVSMYLVFYLTDVLRLPTGVLWWVLAIMVVARVYDALSDPVMGVIVDNTHTRWGKFKPWIAIGVVLSSVFTVLLFSDLGLSGGAFIGMFAFLYLFWGMTYTSNDIGYWSMLPSLSVDQKERERIGSKARIFANIGMFFVVAGIVPITTALGDHFGSLQKGYFYFALIIVTVMLLGQCVTLFGVKESGLVTEKRHSTGLKEMVRVIFKNDQLLFTAISMSLFMIGYVTTTSFGLYYFKYVYGDENMYPIFAVILGVSQITALAVFPLFSKRFSRKTLYTAAIALIVAGYIVFFFAPTGTMLFIGIAGILIFVGQSFIQLLMLMFLADTVDYGHWKLGKRNDSITFSLQPFINKIGGAIASGIVGAVVILSGIKDAGGTENPVANVPASGLLLMKIAMLIFPLILIVVSYLIYRSKYRIDSKMHARILADLRARGELKDADAENETP